MELEKLLPKWNCPRCGDWFHMPYKFCACNTRRPQSEQKIMPGQTKFIGDYDITNLGKSVVYVGKVGRKMTILDELDRLHKAASVYSFLSNSSEDAEWVRFIEGCQKHLPALIEVARAAQSLDIEMSMRPFSPDTWVISELRKSLEKLK